MYGGTVSSVQDKLLRCKIIGVDCEKYRKQKKEFVGKIQFVFD
jgi:hypothetical protein